VGMILCVHMFCVVSLDRKVRLRQLGIFFDDDYDYEQHLKPVGVDGGGVFLSKTGERVQAVSVMRSGLPADIFASELEEDLALLNRAVPGSDIGV
jgi:hypothetical protein